MHWRSNPLGKVGNNLPFFKELTYDNFTQTTSQYRYLTNERRAIMTVEQTEKATKSTKTVRNYVWFSMGAGLIPVPFLDLAAISGLQLKMIHTLSKQYETPFKDDSGKAIISALLGYIVPDSLSRSVMGSLLKAIPVIGPLSGGLSMSLFTGASTYAIGKIFIRHFEAGGTLLNFDPDKMREYFKKEFEKGKEVVAEFKNGKSTETESEVEPSTIDEDKSRSVKR